MWVLIDRVRRSRLTIALASLQGRDGDTVGFRRTKLAKHQAQSAVRRPASRVNSELNPANGVRNLVTYVLLQCGR